MQGVLGHSLAAEGIAHFCHNALHHIGLYCQQDHIGLTGGFRSGDSGGDAGFSGNLCQTHGIDVISGHMGGIEESTVTAALENGIGHIAHTDECQFHS